MLMKRLLSILLTLVICFVLLSPTSVDAAIIKLNKSSLTLSEGSTFSLKLLGTTKSVKWSSSNKTIVTVTTKGIVKGIKSGSATVTATLSHKKYNCKITVKHVLTNTEASANVKYETTETNQGLVVVLDNENKIDVMPEVSIVFFDSNNNMLSTDDDYFKTLKAGSKGVMVFKYPYDSNYNKVDYNHFEITISVDVNNPLFKLKSYSDKVKVKSNIGANSVVANATNDADKDLDGIELTAIYYSNGIIVGTDDKFIYGLSSGKSKTINFNIPHDSNYDDIIFDDYEILVSEAYTYK